MTTTNDKEEKMTREKSYVYWNEGDEKPETIPEGCETFSEVCGEWWPERSSPGRWDILQRRWPAEQVLTSPEYESFRDMVNTGWVVNPHRDWIDGQYIRRPATDSDIYFWNNMIRGDKFQQEEIARLKNEIGDLQKIYKELRESGEDADTELVPEPVNIEDLDIWVKVPESGLETLRRIAISKGFEKGASGLSYRNGLHLVNGEIFEAHSYSPTHSMAEVITILSNLPDVDSCAEPSSYELEAARMRIREETEEQEPPTEQEPSTLSILQEAEKLIHGNRREDYGHPLDDFKRTANMWSAILGIKVTAQHVPLCMVALKISRQCNAHKRDNLVDGAGYFGTLEMVIDEQERKNKEPDNG